MTLHNSAQLAVAVLFGSCLLTTVATAQPCLMLVAELDQVVPAAALPQSEVTLEGFGFQPGACLVSVTFGGTPSPATEFIDAFQLIVTVPDLASGSYNVQVTTVGGTSNTVPFTVLGVEPDWTRADCNQDGSFDIADAVAVLTALFNPGAAAVDCVDACDANDDGAFDISDAIFGLASLFTSGVDPAAPYPNCGTDPTADTLDCEEFAACP